MTAGCEPRSHPPFVHRAYWKGAVIASTFLAICLAMDLATNLLTMSPSTIPRAPPSNSLRAVIRPNRMACTIAGGTFPEARREPTRAKKSGSPSFSNTVNKWSDVIHPTLRHVWPCANRAKTLRHPAGMSPQAPDLDTQLFPWKRRSLRWMCQRSQSGDVSWGCSFQSLPGGRQFANLHQRHGAGNPCSFVGEVPPPGPDRCHFCLSGAIGTVTQKSDPVPFMEYPGQQHE